MSPIRPAVSSTITGWSHGGSWPGIYTKSVRFPEIPASFVAFTLDTYTHVMPGQHAEAAEAAARLLAQGESSSGQHFQSD